MINFLFWFFILTIPYIIVLFFSASIKKRVIYSHFLLKKLTSNKFKNRFRIFLLLYYDLIFDLLIIILLSLILSNINIFKKNRIAYIIDSSYSIKENNYREIYNYLKKRNINNDDIYILSYNKDLGINYLYMIKNKSYLKNFNEFYSFIKNNFVHFNNNYKQMYYLFKNLYNKYKKIIYLTDFFPFKSTNINIIKTGFTQESIFYPFNINYNILTKNFEIFIYKTGDNFNNLFQNMDFQIFKILFSENNIQNKKNKIILQPFSNYKIIVENNKNIKLIFNDPGIFLFKEKNISFILNLEYFPLKINFNSKFPDYLITFFNNLELKINSEIHYSNKNIINLNLSYYQLNNQINMDKKKYQIIKERNCFVLIKNKSTKNNNSFYYYLNPEETLNNYFYQTYFKSMINNNLIQLNSSIKTNIMNFNNIIFINPDLENSIYFPYILLNKIINIKSINKKNSPFADIKKPVKMKLLYDGKNSYIYLKKNQLVIKNLNLSEFIKDSIKEKNFIINIQNNSKLIYFILIILIFILKLYMIFSFNYKFFKKNLF